MKQQTNENNPTPCGYQELNPEMDAFLAGYLEDGRRKGLQKSTIHLSGETHSCVLRGKQGNHS